MSIHNYHLLLPKNLISEINCIKEFGEYSFSKKINFILHKTDKIIRHIDILKINEDSSVEYLKTRKNIHLYMKNKLFKKIKIYHGKFNSYSIAVFVRIIIRLFINMVSRYGYNQALKRINRKCKTLYKFKKIRDKKYRVIQLLYYLHIEIDELIKLEYILAKLLL